jgi:site-specific recombinase XerD
LIRLKVVASNPCDALERPKVTPSAARGLSGEQIHRLLDIVPTTPVGLRDRAIITLTFTGRRAEVLGMTAGSIDDEGGTVFHSYRGKGGKTGKRELPRPAYEAIQEWLACLGKDLVTMPPEASLWPDTRAGRGITSGTFYTDLRRYLKKAGLPAAGVHVFRHAAAKLRRDAGESIEEVSRFLDHSNLSTTTTYLRRLEGQGDSSWEKVAQAIGIKANKHKMKIPARRT